MAAFPALAADNPARPGRRRRPVIDLGARVSMVRRSEFPRSRDRRHGQASFHQDPPELLGGHRFFYVTKKNARTKTDKMIVKKYDPVVRKHVEFKEGKIK